VGSGHASPAVGETAATDPVRAPRARHDRRTRTGPTRCAEPVASNPAELPRTRGVWPHRAYSQTEGRSTRHLGGSAPVVFLHGERSMSARPSAVVVCLVVDLSVDLRASTPRKRPSRPLQQSLHCLGRDERAEPRRHSRHQTEHAADDSRLLELPHARQHPTGQAVPTVFLDLLRRKPPGSALGQGRGGRA
jgi:hypothetical protein